MKILYSKKKRKYNLFQGIFWILLFAIGVLFSDRKNVFFYLNLIMGLVHIYLYLKVKYYLIIEKDVLKQNYIFGKKMELSEIKSIKHFAGEYILRTDKRKMRIDIGSIEKSSLAELRDELKKLDVQWI
jgi:hypothetical protein